MLKREKRITNCFKFILSLSLHSPSAPGLQGAGDAFLFISFPPGYSYRCSHFSTKAVQWGNDVLGFTGYGKVVVCAKNLLYIKAFVWKYVVCVCGIMGFLSLNV